MLGPCKFLRIEAAILMLIGDAVLAVSETLGLCLCPGGSCQNGVEISLPISAAAASPVMIHPASMSMPPAILAQVWGFSRTFRAGEITLPRPVVNTTT